MEGSTMQRRHAQAEECQAHEDLHAKPVHVYQVLKCLCRVSHLQHQDLECPHAQDRPEAGPGSRQRLQDDGRQALV